MSIFNFTVCSVAVILFLLMLFWKKTGNKTQFCFVLNDLARIQRRSVNVYKTIRPVLLS